LTTFKIHKILFRNIGGKIISVVFAILLWLHVTAQQGEDQSFDIPLVLEGMPDSLTIVHEVPQFVEVTIRGPRSSLLKMRLFSRPLATVDLSHAGRGMTNIPLLPAILNLSDAFDPRDVTIDEPKSLNLNFEQVVTRSVPVRVAFKGGMPDDLVLGAGPVIIPARVKVSGASSVVKTIDFISTQEMDVRNRRGKITEETGLFLEGRNITTTPEKVLVEMEIHRRMVRTLSNIPPTLVRDDNSGTVEYSPKSVSITLEGPEEIIKAIKASDVSVIVNITAKKHGTYKLQPEVIVPGGVEKYFLDTEIFEIKILKNSGAGKAQKRAG
jgi:YbbR domain-containing protein